MIKRLKKIKISETLIRELLLVSGFIGVMKGLYSINPAAMWIIGGAILIWAGYPGRRLK